MSEKEVKGYRFSITNNTLYITKGFERQAGKYGTDEYTIFLGYKKDNPELVIEYMKDYKKERSRKNVHSLKASFIIEAINDSENNEAKKELLSITHKYADTREYIGKLKKLYFDTYPAKATLSTLKKKEKDRQKEAEKAEFIKKSKENGTSDSQKPPEN
jgi:hypothetical protein